MTTSTHEFKRARPLLGTFFEICAVAEDEADAMSAMTHAFELAESLERTFSLHDRNSEISRLNDSPVGVRIEVSDPMARLLELALRLWQISRGAFCPFLPKDVIWPANCLEIRRGLPGERGCVRKNLAVRIDLNGLAKGFIVDEACAQLRHELPARSGVVNAGGDLRFLTASPAHEVNLRLGSVATPRWQPLTTPTMSVATSALNVSLDDAHSTTRYHRPLRAALTADHAAVVLAEDCALADALTKVALFAEPGVIESCAREFSAQVLIFDGAGALIETFGDA